MLIIGMTLGLQVTVDDLFIADKVCVLVTSNLASPVPAGNTVYSGTSWIWRSKLPAKGY